MNDVLDNKINKYFVPNTKVITIKYGPVKINVAEGAASSIS